MLVFNAVHQWKGLRSPDYGPKYSYWERLDAVATRLVPRGLGTQLIDGRPTLGTIPTDLLLAGLSIVALGTGIYLWRQHPTSRPILLVAVLNTFGIAAFSNAWFTDDARYFVSFVPPIAILLGAGITHVRVGHHELRAAMLIAALIVTLTLVPIYRDGRFARGDPNGDVPVVVDTIRAAGLRCAVGDYWSTHRLDYLADGRLHAAADPPYVVRIAHLFDEIVARPGRFARIAPVGSWFDARYQNEAGDDWRRIEVRGTAVFLPAHPAPDVRTDVC